MDIDNNLGYWLNISSDIEADEKVITGDWYKTTEKHLELLKKLEFKKTDNVLDFGCGVGRLTNPVADKCGYLVGADISDGMLLRALKNCKKKGIGFKSLKDEMGSGLLHGAYDKIFSFIVLQHIEKSKVFATLANLQASLKIGGKMMIQFPNLEKLKEMYQTYMATKHIYTGMNPRMEFYTETELDYLFDALKMKYEIIKDETDFYVLAEKVKEISFPVMFVVPNLKW